MAVSLGKVRLVSLPLPTNEISPDSVWVRLGAVKVVK